MADNVFDVLLAIATTEGGLSHPEAIQFFDKMKQEKRFTSDEPSNRSRIPPKSP